MLLGAAFLIGHYDMTILTLALPDVQASFNIAEEDVGKLVAMIRLGSLPALLLAIMADQLGRRRLLVLTLVGMSLFSIATAFAQTAQQYMVFQAFVRLFGSLEEILAVIYALELLPARYRGWGVGFLAAMGGLGSGLGSLLYGGVDSLPGGWRAMYALAGVAILLIAYMRRSLPESPMFEAKQSSNLRSTFWEPLKEIFTFHRQTAVALAVIAFAFWFQISAGLNFMSKFLQDQHGYSTGQVSILFIVAGTVAIFGNVVAGRMSDRVGRRPIIAGAIALNCCAFLVFYNTSGWLIPLAWIAALFSFFVVDVIAHALSGELFPTSCRSTASTLRYAVGVLAAALGLTLEGSLYTAMGSHGAALSLMTLSSLLALPAIAFWLKETANTQLK